jgi:ketosteroid isomerase-like protein
MSNRPELVKQFFEAFSKGNRSDFIESLLAPNFTFSAPPDPFLDRKGFFEICWPEGHNLQNIKYVRILENGNEVIITHEYIKPDGIKGCNTDIITFADNKIIRLEAYFGWDIKD